MDFGNKFPDKQEQAILLVLQPTPLMLSYPGVEDPPLSNPGTRWLCGPWSLSTVCSYVSAWAWVKKALLRIFT